MLDMVTSAEYRLRDAPRILEFGDCDNDLPAVLAEAIESKDDREHLFAAWLTVAGAQWTPRLIGEAQLARAVAIVSQEPRSGNAEDRLFLVSLLADCATSAATPWLRSLLNDPDDRLRICAAAALSRLDPGKTSLTIELLNTLQAGVRHDDGGVAMVAARELIRIGMKKETQVEALAEQLRTAEEPLKFVALATLRGLGEKAAQALTEVRAFIEDEGSHPFLRGYAAAVAGCIAPNEPATEEVLLSLLASDNEDLLQGCLTGVHALRRVPPQALDRLVALLSSSNVGIRIAAARAIQLMGPAAVSAVPQLLKQVGEEKKYETVDVFADAVAAIGTPAIPELLRVTRESDFSRLPVLAMVLFRMGVANVVAFSDAMGDEDNEWAIVVLCTVVRDLAHRAAPLVPKLVHLLEEADSEDKRKVVLMALAAVGPAVEPAIPILLRVMTTFSDELSLWAERALWNAGPMAIAALEAALKTATDEQEPRLIRLLGGLTAVDAHMRGYRWFEQLQDDGLVRTFVCIAEILYKGPASYETVEKKLRERGTVRVHSDLAFGHKTLNNCIKKLEKLRGIRLTTSANRSKGELTEAGRDLLRSARAYLRRKGSLPRPT